MARACHNPSSVIRLGCADAVVKKYRGELDRNFGSLPPNQIDRQMEGFSGRSYEDYKRCLEGKSISPMQPLIPGTSGGGVPPSRDSGPDWWGRFKNVPTLPATPKAQITAPKAQPVVPTQPKAPTTTSPKQEPSNTPPLKAQAILAIDGVGPLLEIFGKDTEKVASYTPWPILSTGENYLRSSLQSFLTALGTNTNVDPMPWSRVTSDTTSAVTQLKAYIKPRGAKGRNGTFTIVAHSWAGVLAYVVFQELQSSNPDLSVDTLVTLGTPVGYLPQMAGSACNDAKTSMAGVIKSFSLGAVQQSPRLAAETSARSALCTTDYLGKYRGKKVSVPANIRRWINWYAAEDGFSAPIVATGTNGKQGVENRRADDSKKIGGEWVGCCPLPSPYIFNNHWQYFAWNYNGSGKDSENIRANAMRVLGELTK